MVYAFGVLIVVVVVIEVTAYDNDCISCL